jgi:hypothetical protein
MKHYTKFNPTTGEIVGCGAMETDAYEAVASVLPPHIEGHYARDRFYIANGQPVEMPPKPSIHHIFDYTTKQWVDPRTNETEWEVVRAQRNTLLQQSDWTQLPDVPLATKEAWAIYRQALRDVTDQPDPFNIVWPVAPG